MTKDEVEALAIRIEQRVMDAQPGEKIRDIIKAELPSDEPDIFVDALASQLDAIRRAAFNEAIAIAKYSTERGEKFRIIQRLESARDATPTEKKTRSDKGHHHRVAGVLQEDVDEAEN